MVKLVSTIVYLSTFSLFAQGIPNDVKVAAQGLYPVAQQFQQHVLRDFNSHRPVYRSV